MNPGQSKFDGDLINSARGRYDRASQGDEPRRGGGGSRPREHNTGHIRGQHKRVGKRGKSLLCMGNPSGPAGHLPCRAEEFCLWTGQLRRTSPSQLRLGRYPTTRGSGRMSPRGRNKFLFAGFGRISVTRLLRLQGKTEKRNRLFLYKKAPLCNVLWGIFTF